MGLGCGCVVCFLNKMGKNRGNRPCRNMAMCRNSHLRTGYERVIAIHGNTNSRTSWIRSGRWMIAVSSYGKGNGSTRAL